MSTSYSANLALALPATGELSGTWGTTVNSNITNMLDEALGYQAFSATGGADTLTIPDGTTGVARSIYIQLNGTGGGSVAVPTTKTKMYFVFNNTASAITFKVTGQTGVSIPAAAKMALVSNGTDIIVAQNYFAALTLGAALPVLSGGTGVTTSTGTGSNVLSASPTLTGTVAGASLSLSSLTSGRVTYATTAGLLTDSANLTFSGTALAVGGTLSTTGNISNNSANPNLILNASASGQTVNYYARVGGVDRFSFGSNNTAESGANAGSDFFINRFSDAGVYLGQFLITRSSGLISSGGALNVAGALTATGTTAGGTSNTGYSFSGSAPAGSLLLNSSGNVGIGTTSPAALLDVNGISILRSTVYFGASPVQNIAADATSIYLRAGVHVFQDAGATATKMLLDASGNLLVGVATANANGGVLQLKSGITFPATAVAATDANTLDDYEEGTWTPTQGAGLTVVGAFSSAGTYTKTGRVVSVYGNVSGATSVAITANTILCAGLPFAASAAVTYPVGSIVAQGLSQVGTVIVAASSIYAPTITATPVMYFSCTYFV